MQKTINEKDRQMKIIKNEMKQKSIKAAKERLQLAEKLKNVKISLEGELKTQKETKIKAQRVASKWRRRETSMKWTESHLVKKLSEDVHYLENENEMMRVQLEEILNEREISTFEGGRYRDEVREVCYSLLARGVSTRDMESIIRTVLKKLGNVNIGKLPKKSVVSNMMIECDQLAKIQVGNTILTGTNNTLHLEGTRKRFNTYSSFQVTTGDGQGLSMGFKDMPAGSANDYMTATKDLFAELAQLMLPKNSMATDVEEKVNS